MIDQRQPSQESPHHGYRGDNPGARDETFSPPGLTIAISREAGARGGTIGRHVGRKLNWQVFGQELLEHLMQDSSIQQEFSDGLSEEANRWVEEQLQRIVARGLDMPPPITAATRLTLALGAQGNVVLIGRGAGYLLPRQSTLHVRLIAPFEDRVAYMGEWLRLTPDEARHRVEVRDSRRAEFLTTFLRIQPGDIHGYDLIVNTSSFGEEMTTELIVQAARVKERLLREQGEESASPVPYQ
jgi:hypothetical protein